MSEKVFILGVGAQKSGTTWLHAYIESFSNANMGFAKEYHIWDAICSPSLAEFKLKKSDIKGYNTTKFLRYAMQTIPGFYENYFNSLFNSGVKFTGDITPSYSALSCECFRNLYRKIKSIDAKMKCVFLMRDPVERCWSAARMTQKNAAEKINAEAFLKSYYQNHQYQIRTRYENTCKNLLNSFNKDELYFGFYETMFYDDEIQRLSYFLGVPVNYEFRDKYFNASPAKEISSNLRDEIKYFYKETYEYCFLNFEQTKLIWN